MARREKKFPFHSPLQCDLDSEKAQIIFFTIGQS
jgi:hypothetical protein